jgi:hypothetical protein
MRVQPYTAAHRAAWNAFVDSAKNGQFLYQRGYMDYHADRFDDASYMVYDAKNVLIACLPASQQGDTVISHGGLTYGDLLIGESLSMLECLDVMLALLAHFHTQGVQTWLFKPSPHTYHKFPSDEPIFIAHCAGGTIVERKFNHTIETYHAIPFTGRRMRGVRKASKANLGYRVDDDLAEYWALYTEMLAERHHTSAYMTYDEIAMLQKRFPNHIELYSAHTDDRMVAGVLVYWINQLVRAQFIAASAQGRELGALDGLFNYMINWQFNDRARYVDFGSSMDPTSGRMNLGLIAQKEGFGARAICTDVYAIDVASGLERLHAYKATL